MKEFKLRDYVTVALLVLLVGLVLRGWDSIVSFLGILFTAIIPLLLGIAIAYVISIPANFFARHFLPNSRSKFVAGFRRPFSLVVTVVLAILCVVFATAILIPAFVETIRMVQTYGQEFIEELIQQPFMDPFRESVQEFLNGDFIQGLKRMDISGFLKMLFGGTVGSVTTYVFTVASTIMTGFFGMLFSFILLTDNTHVPDRVMGIACEYIGPKRTQQIALVIGVADASFHNFIVRQAIEASILGTVGATVLFILDFPYALGVGVLMGLCALIPIVGYPVGLCLGAFMISILSPASALIYILTVAITQILESTFVLPHVGDPRTALPPVWVTVGVTIGGGVAGFLGMLLAIPITATIRQLIILDVRHRQRELPDDIAIYPSNYGQKKRRKPRVKSHKRKPKLSQGLEHDDGDGVGKVK